MRSSQAPATDPELWGSVPERPYAWAAARLGTDPDAVQAALDKLDASVRRREERRRAATRDLVAELYARDGIDPSPERIDAGAEAACAQERDERLAAELRRLVTPAVAVIRRARTLTDQELDGDCQAALHVLATAPRSLAEFQPVAEQRFAAERALVDRYAQGEARAAGLLKEVRGWQLRRRRRSRGELAAAGRGRQAAAHRARAAAARLAAVQLRQAQRAEWLAQPKVQEVLGAGAAALRELHDRAQALDGGATAELPTVDRPTPGTVGLP
jgi:hypothetical protein